MKKIKKLSIVASIVAFMLVVSNGSHNVAMAEESSVTNNSQGVRLNDDFYDAVK